MADPDSISANLAWTFVFMMPIVKVLDSICSGCSLFLGRRVCVRMKAVIIGEVYAKALRRKITVTETISEEPSIDDKNHQAMKIVGMKRNPKLLPSWVPLSILWPLMRSKCRKFVATCTTLLVQS